MQQLSLIMFSCKHELASIVTYSCFLMGKVKMMTNLPVCKRRSSTSQFRLQLVDACPSPLVHKKKIFATAMLIRLKPPTTHKKVLQYMVGFLRLGIIMLKKIAENRHKIVPAFLYVEMLCL